MALDLTFLRRTRGKAGRNVKIRHASASAEGRAPSKEDAATAACALRGSRARARLRLRLTAELTQCRDGHGPAASFATGNIYRAGPEGERFGLRGSNEASAESVILGSPGFFWLGLRR